MTRPSDRDDGCHCHPDSSSQERLSIHFIRATIISTSEGNMELGSTPTSQDDGSVDGEVFGDDSEHQIKYRTLTWPFVAMIMITESRCGLELLLLLAAC